MASNLVLIGGWIRLMHSMSERRSSVAPCGFAAASCCQCVELGRGEVRMAEPIAFVRDEGRTARDLVGTTHATIRLVSGRLLDVIGGHGFTGWGTYPVGVAVDDGRWLDGYEGFVVTGRCGAIDDRLSQGSSYLRRRAAVARRLAVLVYDLPGNMRAAVFLGRS